MASIVTTVTSGTTPTFSIPGTPPLYTVLSEQTKKGFTAISAASSSSGGTGSTGGNWKFPLPDSLSYDSSYKWTTEELGQLTGKVISNSVNAVKTAYNSNKTGQDLLDSAMSGIGSVDFKDIGRATLNEVARKSITKAAEYATGSKAAGNEIFKQATGTVYNPNEQAYFEGVKFREFDISFKITPLSATEARQFAQAVNALKKCATPTFSDSTNFFFTYPCLFSVQVSLGSNVILNRSKCAITSLDIDLTPDGELLWRTDYLPSSYEIKIGFMETTPPTQNVEDANRLFGI